MNIHRRLQNVYKEKTFDYSDVRRWVCRLNVEKVGTASVADKPRSDRPSYSVNPANTANADALTREDRLTTLDELAENFGVLTRFRAFRLSSVRPHERGLKRQTLCQ